jgi:nicotinamidase-related amidase
MNSRGFLLCTVAAAVVLASLAAPVVRAADAIAEWTSIKAPPAPELKSVTVDRKTTALLILDVNKPGCVPERRVRCVDTLPHLKKLMDGARAAGVPVLYTFSGTAKPADIADPAIMPREDEVVMARGPDKFLGSELERKLKEKGVTTVIVTGTSANGAVIGTGGGAAMRGFKVIVPVDGMSADSAFMEQYVAFHFANAPTLSTQSTLTRSDMIKF